MEMIIPIMMATSPIWLLLLFIAWLIAKDYEATKYEIKLLKRKERNNVDGGLPVLPSDIGEKIEMYGTE